MAKKNEDKKDIKEKVGAQVILKGAELINSSVQLPLENVDLGNVEFNLNIDLKPPIEGLVPIIVKITMHAKTEMPIFLGLLHVAVLFQVVNHEQVFVQGVNNEIGFPSDFGRQLCKLAIDTVRGYMICHFKGSYLQNVVLPLFADTMMEEKMNVGEVNK
jgi:hypothetical protein